MDDAPASKAPPRAPPRGFESAPYLVQKRRVQQLWPELRKLGLETHIAELAVQGFTILPPEKVAPPDYIAALRSAVLKVSERRTGIAPDVATGATHAGGAHPLGQFMRYVLFEDPVFEPVLTNPVLLGLITYLVGFDAILSLNDAMVKGPGGAQLAIHNDNGDLATPVYADQPQTANINLLLSDYEEGSGPIAFLPGSHLFRRQPTPAEVADLVGEMVPVIAPAGSAVIWPANTWHMAFPRRDPGLRLTLLYDFSRASPSSCTPMASFRSAKKISPPRIGPPAAAITACSTVIPCGQTSMGWTKAPSDEFAGATASDPRRGNSQTGSGLANETVLCAWLNRLWGQG
jgi:hypothetical protein